MPEQQIKKQKKSTLPRILIIGSIALVLAGGYYLYTTYMQTSVAAGEKNRIAKQFPFKKIDWQKEIFSNPIFQSLTTEVPLQIRVEVGAIGNASPFITTR